MKDLEFTEYEFDLWDLLFTLIYILQTLYNHDIHPQLSIYIYYTKTITIETKQLENIKLALKHIYL
jgi:hypothetical protein